MSFGPPPSVYTESTLAAESRKKRRRLFALGATTTALAMLFAGIWVLSYDGTDTASGQSPAAASQGPDDIRETIERRPTTPEGVSAVARRAEGIKAGQNIETTGTWATAKTFAKTLGNAITGYKISTDREAWKLGFPGSVCAATPHVTVDGRTAVAFSVEPTRNDPNGVAMSGPCDGIAMFDIDTGKRLWHVKLPEKRLVPARITMTRGRVVAAWEDGSAAYAMTDGKLLWSHTAGSVCGDSGYAGGRALVRLVKCGDAANRRFRVEGTDPKTGKPLWTYEVAPGIQDVRLISSSPVVIAVAAGDLSITDLISLSDQGRFRASISVPNRNYVTKCGDGIDVTGPVETCDAVVVGERQLYISTQARDVSTVSAHGQVPNEIVAFDLATGKSVRKYDAKIGRPMYPVRMSGDKLIAARQSFAAATPSAAVSIDPTSGKETLLLLFGTVGLPPFDSLDVRYEHGRIFFAATSLTGPVSKDDEGESLWLADGFETGG
ncbi:PQQ-binding-like beta-propeller repeat protein [Streptomyces sp. MMG1533]|uniref:outer membrane protein assembly factor BamB family protein n=1 Tax=Streptomyces sp. MMG1533 TaxID=1415546 RepID=UPI0006AFD7D0|nr:PQQ-binding-like beta-propeller repeat protein [Streptomyces sp. MMG1533]